MNRRNIEKVIAYIKKNAEEFNQSDPKNCLVGFILKTFDCQLASSSDAGRAEAARFTGIPLSQIKKLYASEWGRFESAYFEAGRGAEEAAVAVNLLKSFLKKRVTARRAAPNYEKEALRILVRLGKVTQAQVNAAVSLARA